MSRQPKRLVVLVVAAALCVPLITAPASAAPQQPADYYIGVSRADLKEGQTYTPEEVRQLQAEAKPATIHRSGAALTSAPDSIDAVASGFVLFNPGFRRSDFVYDSDWGKAQLIHCSGSTCTVESTYETQLHQYLYGGSSKRWQLTLNIRYKSGTNASSFGYWYGCAINVSGGADHYCLNGASASGVSGTIQPGGKLERAFENNSYPNKEYPMVGISVHWPQASTENKDRGYDVCTSASSKLCTSSGTG